MKLLWMLASLLLAYTVVAQRPNGHQESDNRSAGNLRIERPPFETIASGTGYEVREYEAKKWVCTTSPNGQGDGVSRRLFMRLFGYIRGNNDQNKRIAMTIPVTTKHSSNEDTTMCFYIPDGYQSSPPQPKHQDVFIYNRPTLTVAVREFIGPSIPGASYGGQLNPDPDWEAQKDKLRSSLAAAGIDGFVDLPNYTVAYDSPTVSKPRFELWFPKA